MKRWIASGRAPIRHRPIDSVGGKPVKAKLYATELSKRLAWLIDSVGVRP